MFRTFSNQISSQETHNKQVNIISYPHKIINFLFSCNASPETPIRSKKKNIYIYISKEIPLQVWTGLEGSRRLRLPDFKTVST